MKKAFLIALPIITIALVAIIIYNSSSKENYSNTHYYFNFDEIVYYKCDISEDDIAEISEKKVKTVKDSMMLRNALDYIFESISTARAISYLDNIDFEKKVIPSSKFPEIRNIFRENNLINDHPACEPVYRDIYIFKKNGKVSGIAKLCYQCGISYFTGTSANTNNFGAKGEFERLKEVVK